MARAVKGRQIILKFNGITVSCQTACEFNSEVDLLPASPIEDGGWKDYIEGARGWTMSVNGNFLLLAAGVDVKNVIHAMNNRLPIFLEFTTSTGAETEYVISGYAKAKQVNISAPVTGVATWNAVFVGSQAYDYTVQDFGLIINAMPIEADYPVIVDTTL